MIYIPQSPPTVRVDASGGRHVTWETPPGAGGWLSVGKAVWCSVGASNHAGAGAVAYVPAMAVAAPPCRGARVAFFGAGSDRGDGARGRAGGSGGGGGGAWGGESSVPLSRLVAGSEVAYIHTHTHT